MNKYQLSQETMQVRCDPYPQCTGVGVDVILWHAQTCWRSIFSPCSLSAAAMQPLATSTVVTCLRLLRKPNSTSCA